MTQKKQLVDLFRKFGNRITLGQILNTTLAAEYRARMTELRNQGFRFNCKIDKKNPSYNEYTMLEPDQNGQTRFV